MSAPYFSFTFVENIERKATVIITKEQYAINSPKECDSDILNTFFCDTGLKSGHFKRMHTTAFPLLRLKNSAYESQFRLKYCTQRAKPFTSN